ncbi:MAG: preprotein translocase subunit SecY [Oscillospiraceae bacterium]|nr:preprotein translocase subunit SecY [Oscillospiraceae bacterium]
MIETLRNAWKIDDLRRKMLYTFMILLIFRIGAAMPVPFMRPEVLADSAVMGDGSLLSYINLLTGGAFSQATLFAMSISPYITASIVMQLLQVAIPALERLAKEGEAGQKKIARISRYATAGLALIQSVAYYWMNFTLGAVRYTDGVSRWFAAIVIVLAYTAGAMLIVWLGESIDKKGIGNGISMILFAGIVSRGPMAIYNLGVNVYTGIMEPGFRYLIFQVLAIVALFLALIGVIVLMTNAERRIPIQYSKRVVGRKMYGGQSSYIPIKVMMSGVMPIIFASSILSIPGMIKGFMPNMNQAGLGYRILSLFDYTHPVYAILYLVLIIAFNYFYVAIQYNPVQMANDLRKNNGAIPGMRPGKPTSDFIAKIISKITLVGALFVALIAILPILLGSVFAMPIALGGTSIIIVVGVALDTVRALESQMMMRHYKGFLE